MTKQRFLLESEINSFHYLYQDAEYLLSAARLPGVKGKFEAVRISRSAFVLFVMSMEGLINRALDHFSPQPLHDFLLEKEDKFSLVDKWRLLALTAGSPPINISIGEYPWSHFAELVKIRNDYVHPKHDRMAYYEFISANNFKHLEWNKIPEGCGIKEGDVVYRQTKIPKDPYGFSITHLEQVKKVVDDTISAMDKILGGKLSDNNWSRSDQMKLCFPPGAKLDDLMKSQPASAGKT